MAPVCKLCTCVQSTCLGDIVDQFVWKVGIPCGLKVGRHHEISVLSSGYYCLYHRRHQLGLETRQLVALLAAAAHLPPPV